MTNLEVGNVESVRVPIHLLKTPIETAEAQRLGGIKNS